MEYEATLQCSPKRLFGIGRRVSAAVVFSASQSSTMPPRPRLSLFARQCAWYLLFEDNTCTAVVNLLRKEGIVTTRHTVWRLERHVRADSCIEPLPKSGRQTKLSDTDMRTSTMQWREMTRRRGKNSWVCSNEMEFPYLNAQCTELEESCDGHREELPTVSSFAPRIV